MADKSFLEQVTNAVLPSTMRQLFHRETLKSEELKEKEMSDELNQELMLDVNHRVRSSSSPVRRSQSPEIPITTTATNKRPIVRRRRRASMSFVTENKSPSIDEEKSRIPSPSIQSVASVSVTTPALNYVSVEETLYALAERTQQIARQLTFYKQRIEACDDQIDDSREEMQYLQKARIATREILQLQMQIEFNKYGTLVARMNSLKSLARDANTPLSDRLEHVLQTVYSDTSMDALYARLFSLQQKQATYVKAAGRLAQQDPLLTRGALTPTQSNSSKWLQDRPLSDRVSTLLCTVDSFEHGQLTGFANKFLSRASGRATAPSIHDENNEVNLTSLPNFVHNLAWHLVRRLDVDESAMAQISDTIECHLFPIIYTEARNAIQRTEQDDLLSAQCRKFGHVTQQDLHVETRDTNPAYVDAVAALRQLSQTMTPRRQLAVVQECIQELLRQLDRSGAVQIVGGDALMDLCVFCVIKANVPGLLTYEFELNHHFIQFSILSFIQEYSDPVLLQGESGYNLATLESAALYVLKLTESQLRPVQMERSLHFLVPESVRYSHLQQSDAKPLEGFKLFAVRPWVFDSSRPFALVCMAVETSDKDGNRNRVTVKKLTRESSPERSLPQMQFVTRALEQPTESFLTTFNSEQGSVVVIRDKSNLLSSLGENALISIPNGDWESCASRVLKYLTLERVDCATEQMDIWNPSEIEQSFALLKQQYHLHGMESLEEALCCLVLEVQVLLRLLAYFRGTLDGNWSENLESSIKQFQMNTNQRETGSSYSHMSVRLSRILLSPDADSNDGSLNSPESSSNSSSALWPVLPQTGRLCVRTFTELQARLNLLSSHLHQLGYPFNGNLIQDHEKFSKTCIEPFQKKHLSHVTGTFDEMTVSLLEQL